ncbi:MAG: hypothetical protein DSM107014_00780 [Gomphosphaeria aponina SAG 52.96 = DSM 107014]|uniref:Uncharacterized protein n=1 Tax=Gomphosphaeria aponina SAG 52.96 = DSM 107014 TaxID=1521640 RepID=A0A941JUC4_9CHRO|nr:hypothetical protein [Gomphosphaeria aponina SAG 52.96 = DSM 107014]
MSVTRRVSSLCFGIISLAGWGIINQSCRAVLNAMRFICCSEATQIFSSLHAITINNQPSTINHQPSTINHQPSTINN